MAIVQSEARLGKGWAQSFLGISLAEDGLHDEAFKWYVQAAEKGNFDAFLALFVKGKGEFLRTFGADIFFDDQRGHCESARQHVPTGHVPNGIKNSGTG